MADGTCLGGWHYDRRVYVENRYKSARTVIHMLAGYFEQERQPPAQRTRARRRVDRRKEEAILEETVGWMAVNSEAIYATRPWKVFGEGPASEGVALSAQGFNERKGKPFTAAAVRYTAIQEGRTVYVIALGEPTEPPRFAAPRRRSPHPTASALASRLRYRWTKKATR